AALTTAAPETLDASAEHPVVEAVIGPRSSLIGRAIGRVPFLERFDAIVLAVRSRGALRRTRIDQVVLRAGDVLLLRVDKLRIAELAGRGDFVLVSEIPV